MQDGLWATALEQARQEWPQLSVDNTTFRAYAEERLQESAGDAAIDEGGIEQLRLGELYLAFACLQGSDEGIRLLEQHFLTPLRAPLGRLGLDTGSIEDVQQRVRQKLLVPAGEGPPKLAAYSGRGSLARWLKVVATREGLNALRATRRERPGEDSMLEQVVAPGDDQELGYLKRHYRAQFKEAFQAALRALSVRERTVLRYQLVDGFNIDQIGAVYGVHRATVARWIARSREQLLSETRRLLTGSLRIGESEFESIMRLISSQLDVSLKRFLQEEEN